MNELEQKIPMLKTYDGAMSSRVTQGIDRPNKSTYYSSDMKELDYSNIDKCNVLIKALGTMVIVPEYETDTLTMRKVLLSNTQKPVLEGDIRTKTLNKLSEILDRL